MRVLVVEDEREVATLIETVLVAEGFEVEVAADLSGARAMLARLEPDLVLVDIGLPDGSGLDLLSEMRTNPDKGLLVVTGKPDEIDMLVGFQMGADDYVTKPFRPRELVARVRAVARRLAPAKLADPAVEIRFGAFRANLAAGWVRDDSGRRLDLTTSELELLGVFLRHRGETLSRAAISARMFGPNGEFNVRFIDGLVSRLRRKLRADRATPVFIRTVHGRGYCFVA